jgi:hypothetical protein
MPTATPKRTAMIAGCEALSFEQARSKAAEDMFFKLGSGDSIMYVGGSGTCHHIGYMAHLGHLVHRSGDVLTTADVAAHNRHHIVHIVKVAHGVYPDCDTEVFEVWVKRLDA